MSKWSTPCREQFDRLEKEYPELLLDWVNSGELRPSQLTFAAENLGQIPEALPILLDLLNHESPLVREGAVIGLARLKDLIDDKVEVLANSDISPGVRHVAGNCVR